MDSFIFGDQTYSIRDPKLDSQQSALIKRILAIPENLNQDRMRQELFLIQKICASNFSYEEVAMKKGGYPNFNDHAEHHREFFKKTSMLSNMITNNVVAGRKLKHFLLDWFERHSENHDTKYLEFCQMELVR